MEVVFVCNEFFTRDGKGKVKSPFAPIAHQVRAYILVSNYSMNNGVFLIPLDRLLIHRKITLQ